MPHKSGRTNYKSTMKHPNPSSQEGFPKGKVGGYRAPVDTTGMTPEEKETFFPKPKPPKPPAKPPKKRG